jgi:putative zinc finger protein
MTCTEFEILLADSLDGILAAELRDSFERHQASCPACAELGRDAAGAMVYLKRVPDVVAPPALVNRILTATSGAASKSQLRLGQWFDVLWQPQFALGVAMALLSLAIAARSWNGASNSVQKAWERTVSSYEDMPLVSEVQYQLQEWVNDRAGAPDGEK